MGAVNCWYFFVDGIAPTKVCGDTWFDARAQACIRLQASPERVRWLDCCDWAVCSHCEGIGCKVCKRTGLVKSK